MCIESTLKPHLLEVISPFSYLDRIFRELLTIQFQLINGVVDKLTDEAGYDEEPHDPEDEARHSREHWEWCKGMLKGLMTPELIYDTAVFMRCQLNLE